MDDVLRLKRMGSCYIDTDDIVANILRDLNNRMPLKDGQANLWLRASENKVAGPDDSGGECVGDK